MRNTDRVFGAVSRVSNAYPGHSASQDGLLPKHGYGRPLWNFLVALSRFGPSAAQPRASGRG